MSSYNYGPEGRLVFSEGKFATGSLLALVVAATMLCLVVGFFESVIYSITGLISLSFIVSAWSHERYNRLQLFEEELRIGRRSIAIAELDPGFSVQKPSDVFDQDEPAESNLAAVVRVNETKELVVFPVHDYHLFAHHLRGRLTLYGTPDEDLPAIMTRGEAQEHPVGRSPEQKVFWALEFIVMAMALVAIIDIST